MCCAGGVPGGCTNKNMFHKLYNAVQEYIEHISANKNCANIIAQARFIKNYNQKASIYQNLKYYVVYLTCTFPPTIVELLSLLRA